MAYYLAGGKVPAYYHRIDTKKYEKLNNQYYRTKKKRIKKKISKRIDSLFESISENRIITSTVGGE